MPRVHEDDREFGGRSSRDHVPGVLDVPRRVRDDELSLGGSEIPISDIDRDSLLTLGPKPVGQKCQVNVAFASTRTRLFDRLHLVFKDGFRIVQQAPNERALAVVDATGRRKPEEIHVQIARIGHARKWGAFAHDRP